MKRGEQIKALVDVKSLKKDGVYTVYDVDHGNNIFYVVGEEGKIDVFNIGEELLEPLFNHEARSIPKEEIMSSRSDAYDFLDVKNWWS